MIGDDNNVIQHVDVAISSAEMLNLHAVAKVLVPAPGANKIIQFVDAVLFYDFNSIAYAGIAAGDNLSIGYTTGTVMAIVETIGFFDQTSDQFRTAALFSPIVETLALSVNSSFRMFLQGAITTGNSPVGVRTFYRVIDVSTLSAT